MALQASHWSANGAIISKARVCGGSPTIAGTRVRVSDIVRYWNLHKDDPQRVLKALPHLNQEQVFAALNYYQAHRDQIEAEIKEEEALASKAG